MKTTYVRLTFGFDSNKFGNSKFYRKGKGKDLSEAVVDLFRQRGNNYLPPEQQKSVIKQFDILVGKLEDIIQNSQKGTKKDG